MKFSFLSVGRMKSGYVSLSHNHQPLHIADGLIWLFFNSINNFLLLDEYKTIDFVYSVFPQ